MCSENGWRKNEQFCYTFVLILLDGIYGDITIKHINIGFVVWYCTNRGWILKNGLQILKFNSLLIVKIRSDKRLKDFFTSRTNLESSEKIDRRRTAKKEKSRHERSYAKGGNRRLTETEELEIVPSNNKRWNKHLRDNYLRSSTTMTIKQPN